MRVSLSAATPLTAVSHVSPVARPRIVVLDVRNFVFVDTGRKFRIVLRLACLRLLSFDIGGTEMSPFAESVLTNRQQRHVWVGDDHSHCGIAGGQRDAADSARRASHRAGVFLRKPDRHALGSRHHHVVASGNDLDVDQIIAVVQFDGDQSAAGHQ